MDIKVGDLICWKHAVWGTQFLIILEIKTYNEASIENGWDMFGQTNQDDHDLISVYLQKPDRAGKHFWRFERHEIDRYEQKQEMEKIE